MRESQQYGVTFVLALLVLLAHYGAVLTTSEPPSIYARRARRRLRNAVEVWELYPGKPLPSMWKNDQEVSFVEATAAGLVTKHGVSYMSIFPEEGGLGRGVRVAALLADHILVRDHLREQNKVKEEQEGLHARRKPKLGCYALDVGAGEGRISLMLMAKGCTVLAIDPVPVRAFGLYKSIRASHFEPIGRVYAAAAGNSSQGHVVLDRNRLAGRYSPFAPQNARVNPNIVREYGDGGRMDPLPPNHMSVNQIRVGDIVTRDVSLLIFDINGYEYQALKGALGIFHQYLLDYVYFPALDVAALREIGGESIYKLFHFLDQFHFKVHCLPPLPASAAAADPQPGAVREILAGTDAGKYLLDDNDFRRIERDGGVVSILAVGGSRPVGPLPAISL